VNYHLRGVQGGMRIYSISDNVPRRNRTDAAVNSGSSRNTSGNPRVTPNREAIKRRTAAGGTASRGRRAPGSKSRSAQPATVSSGSSTAGLMTSRKPAKRVHTIVAAERKPFPLLTTIMVIAATTLFLAMISGYVRINEFSKSIEEMRVELNTLEAEKKDLTLQLEEKNDLRVIEEYATEVLGMVQSDQNAKKFITVTAEDTIEVLDEYGDVAEPRKTMLERLQELFDAFVEFINSGA